MEIHFQIIYAPSNFSNNFFPQLFGIARTYTTAYSTSTLKLLRPNEFLNQCFSGIVSITRTRKRFLTLTRNFLTADFSVSPNDCLRLLYLEFELKTYDNRHKTILRLILKCLLFATSPLSQHYASKRF